MLFSLECYFANITYKLPANSAFPPSMVNQVTSVFVSSSTVTSVKIYGKIEGVIYNE